MAISYQLSAISYQLSAISYQHLALSELSVDVNTIIYSNLKPKSDFRLPN